MKALRATLLLVALVVPLFAVASDAAAGRPQTRDGFWARFALGPGYGYTTSDGAGLDATVQGLSLNLDLALGLAVTPNLALYADLYGYGMPGPEISIGSMSGSASDDVTFVLAGIGLGMAYYFPSDGYIAVSAGWARLSIDQGGNTVGESDVGFGLNFLGGMDWWVGQELTLGGALNFTYGWTPDSGTSLVDWHNIGLGLVFVITYS